MAETTDGDGIVNFDNLIQARPYPPCAGSYRLVRVADGMVLRFCGDLANAQAHARALIAEGRVS